MCYNLKDVASRNLKISVRYGYPEKEVEELIRLHEHLKKSIPDLHFVSGFEHPQLISIIDDEGHLTAHTMRWGLIPHWIKDKPSAYQISNKTLNARGETLFEKPAFRQSAKHRRCIIPVDGFYEYHHSRGNKIPFYIHPDSGDKLLLAGVWDRWHSQESHKDLETLTIVTTKASDLMRKVQHKSQSVEMRMPVILPTELAENWIKPLEDERDITGLKELIKPYNDSELEVYPVRKLIGKDGVGNSPLASERYDYENEDTFEF